MQPLRINTAVQGARRQVEYPVYQQPASAVSRGRSRRYPQQGGFRDQQGIPYNPRHRDMTPSSARSYSTSSSALPPHPPFEIIPDEVGRTPEIIDLSGDNLTEEEYRELLTKYLSIRIERKEPIDFNSAGEKSKTTWKKTTWRRLPDIDNVKAREEILRLDVQDKDADKGRGVSLRKKQNSLGPNASDALQRVTQELAAEVLDPRFQVVLAQFDSTCRKIVVDCQERVSWKHTTTGKTTRDRRKEAKRERTSITAHFKILPKPQHNAKELYLEQEQELYERQFRPQREQHDRELRQLQADREESEERLRQLNLRHLEGQRQLQEERHPRAAAFPQMPLNVQGMGGHPVHQPTGLNQQQRLGPPVHQAVPQMRLNDPRIQIQQMPGANQQRPPVHQATQGFANNQVPLQQMPPNRQMPPMGQRPSPTGQMPPLGQMAPNGQLSLNGQHPINGQVFPNGQRPPNVQILPNGQVPPIGQMPQQRPPPPFIPQNQFQQSGAPVQHPPIQTPTQGQQMPNNRVHQVPLFPGAQVPQQHPHMHGANPVARARTRARTPIIVETHNSRHHGTSQRRRDRSRSRSHSHPRNHHRSHSRSSSYYSDYSDSASSSPASELIFSEDEGSGTDITPLSRSSNGRSPRVYTRVHRTAHRSHRHRHDAGRRHVHASQHGRDHVRNSREHRVKVSSTPQLRTVPSVPLGDVLQMRDDAYERGRSKGRAEAEDKVDMHAESRKYRPERVDIHPEDRPWEYDGRDIPGVRPVTRGEKDRRMRGDRFNVRDWYEDDLVDQAFEEQEEIMRDQEEQGCRDFAFNRVPRRTYFTSGPARSTGVFGHHDRRGGGMRY